MPKKGGMWKPVNSQNWQICAARSELVKCVYVCKRRQMYVSRQYPRDVAYHPSSLVSVVSEDPPGIRFNNISSNKCVYLINAAARQGRIGIGLDLILCAMCRYPERQIFVEWP